MKTPYIGIGKYAVKVSGATAHTLKLSMCLNRHESQGRCHYTLCRWTHFPEAGTLSFKQARPRCGGGHIREFEKLMVDPASLFEPPFEVISPEHQSAPLVFNSPHSGRVYPASFVNASKLDSLSLRKSEDCFVDELFRGVVDVGAPLMHARFPRAYLDLNREPYELDPMMFSDPLPDYVNTRSVRAAGGLGTVARIVSETAEIYKQPLTFAEAQQRITSLYIPYHARLRALLTDARDRFGTLLMVDCHSMPSTVTAGHTKRSNTRPDFVLGDRYGAACANPITDFVEILLTRLGYSVVRNKPYAGGYITQTYGRPHKGIHTLQVEINRGLYIDEGSLEKHAGFERLLTVFQILSADLADMLPTLVSPDRAAAE